MRRCAHPSSFTLTLTSQLTGGSSSARVLNLEVTDETDPFFLHSLTVGEAEYAELRADQALLVDFASFPTHLLQLLESCVAAKAEASPKCAHCCAGVKSGSAPFPHPIPPHV